jgi:hypothetical protein
MIEHTLDGITYQLRPDGGLDLADAGRALWPRGVPALARRAARVD